MCWWWIRWRHWSEGELEGEMGDSHMASRRGDSQALRKLTGIVSNRAPA